MRFKEALSYITGADYLGDAIQSEKDLLREATGEEHSLPLQADLKTSATIYVKRLKTMVVYPVVLASRVTGVDAAVRCIKGKHEPKLS